MHKSIAITLVVLAAPFAHESAAQVIYDRQHDLLVAAIEAGHADGVLIGPAAELFTRHFRSVGPLQVTAEVIKSFPREGCKRLRIIYTKKHVIGPDGPQDVTLDTKMNYCADGKPPVDLGKTQ